MFIMKKMSLFKNEVPGNLLPIDGVVNYYGKVMELQQARNYLEALLQTIEWKNDEAIIFGKHIVTRRKVAWYADSNFEYTYSSKTKFALPWTKELLELKMLVEKRTGAIFNSCLLNLYHNGDEGMAWHSDDEKTLQSDAPIASLSFGAERKFMLRHKQTKETLSIILQNGSLLLMRGSTQTNWQHSLPKSKKIMTPRINLTFRIMLEKG